MSFRRWWLPRRLLQVALLLLMATPLPGWNFFQGNLASASLLGLKLSDPLAFLQVILASRIMIPAFGGSALLILILYFFTGGRSFCGWVCPVNLMTELLDPLRQRLTGTGRTWPLGVSYGTLAITLVLTAITGTPLFEILSPIGAVSRAIAFASFSGLSLLGGICLLELSGARRIWCRSLCPLGGFYTLLGRYTPLKIRFIAENCTHCGACQRACFVGEVLRPPLEEGASFVTSGACSRCARCIDACPTDALRFGITMQR
jgi:ferredoxin-type protein NapH